MNSGLLILILLVLRAALLTAQDDEKDARCKQYLQTPLPTEAQAVVQPKAWPNCDSYKSYSGLGRKVDYDAARQCAWQERLATQAELEPRYTVGSIFGGSAMLTALYANGEGVKANLALAARFACEAGGAPAEIGIRLDHLESRGKPGPEKAKFDFCDDITSGFMEGFCAGYSSEIGDQTRESAIKELLARMPKGLRQGFDDLVRAEQAYSRAHGSGEIDSSGTARAMYAIDAEDTLREDFVAALKLFEQGKGFPQGTDGEYRAVDAKLNSTYRSVLSNAEARKSDYGAVQPEQIRVAERAWLRYRDLFVAFALLRYPTVPKGAWLTLLTQDRTSILDGSFCDMDETEGKCAWQGDTWKPSPLP
ncbi:MAG TPA: lysozyme inhibitor LprI family protein [Terracidiphilus sp.]